MKKCVQCGAMLPDEAALCPYCAASQVERHVVSPPRRINRFRLRRTVMAVVVTVSLVGSAAAIVLGTRAIREKERLAAEAAALAAQQEQQEQEAERADPLDALLESLAIPEEAEPTPLPGNVAEGAEYPFYVSYTAQDGRVYLLFAGMPEADLNMATPCGRWESWAVEGGRSGITLVLCAKRAGELPCPRDFDHLVASYRVEEITGNASVWLEEADLAGIYRYAEDLLQSYLVNVVSPAGQAVIRWTVEMKNGDVIYLDQVIQVSPKQEIVIEDARIPMGDAASLQRLLDAIEPLTFHGRYTFTVRLPAVTYTDTVRIGANVTLMGMGEDTVFAAGVIVEDKVDQVIIWDATFIGQGGVGLTAARHVFLMGCRLSGWDVAVTVGRFGRICADYCLFTDNTVGVDINSVYGGVHTLGVCELYRNDTAVRVSHMSRDNSLWLNKCIFGENGADIDNPEHYAIGNNLCRFT